MTDPEAEVYRLISEALPDIPNTDAIRAASVVADKLGLAIERAVISGLEYLSPPSLYRIVSHWSPL